MRRIFRTKPLSNFVLRELSPGADVSVGSREMDRWVLRNHTSNSHWCCSVRMGDDDAAAAGEAPLEPELLTLRGVENVHVADASVFPAIPNGNVHSTVVSVAAEFAARLAEQMEVDSGH